MMAVSVCSVVLLSAYKILLCLLKWFVYLNSILSDIKTATPIF